MKIDCQGNVLEEGVKLNDKYKIEKLLGQGNFGMVFQVTSKDSRLPMAIKIGQNTK